MKMFEGVVIAAIPKNKREEIRLTLTSYRGKDLLDVRCWYYDGEEWQPGKGVSIKQEHITDLRIALQKAEAAIHAESGVAWNLPEQGEIGDRGSPPHSEHPVQRSERSATG